MNASKDYRRTVGAIGTALAAAVAGAMPSLAGAAMPTVEYDLRVHGTGAKTVDVTYSGETVVLDLYAFVRGLDLNPDNDGISSGSGLFRSSTGGLLGDLLGLGPPSPFNALGSTVGGQIDSDSDGDLDIDVTAAIPSSYSFRIPPPAPMPQPAEGHFVGQVQFTVGDFSLSETSIAWTQRTGLPTLVGIADGAGINRTLVNIAYGAPVTIRGVTLTPPPGVVYMSGNIAAHTSITQNTWVAPGQSLTFETGVDIAASGTLNAAGQTLQIRVNDATSGNAGGAIVGGNISIGTTANGTFTQSGGSTQVGSIIAGANATRTGRLDVTGGTLQGNQLTLGPSGGGTGVYTQGGGTADFVNLNVANNSTATVSGTGQLHVAATSIIGDGSTGTFTQAGGSTNLQGDLKIGAGSGGVGTLVVQDGTLVTGSTFIGIDGGVGSLQVSGGVFKPTALALNRFAGAPPTVTITGGLVQTNTIQFLFPAVVTQSGGTVTTGATSNLWLKNEPGEFQYALSNGTLNAPSVLISKTNAAPVAASGKVGGFAQSGGTSNIKSLTIESTGTANVTGGTMNINSKLDLRGALDFGGGNTHLNVNSSAFASFVAGQLIAANNATFTGASGSLMSFKDQAQYDSVGTVTSQGLIHIAGQDLVIPQNQSVGGSGTIEGDVTNNGSLAPGSSPGAITVDGSYTQAASGLLLMEIAGIEPENFDSLAITGPASLDGLLNVSLLDGFLPSATDSFSIVTANSLSGTFDNVSGNKIGFTGGTFDVAYSPTGVTLSNFQAVPEPGGVALIALAMTAVGVRRQRIRRRA
jgi:hypothetical protein